MALKSESINLKKLEKIGEIIKCTICLNDLKNPHVCPSCSQLFCLGCINEWLHNEGSSDECPHCKADKISNKLIKIRWVDEIQEIFKENNFRDMTLAFRNLNLCYSTEKCKLHQEDLKLFCSNCNIPICCSCLETPIHEGHTAKGRKFEHRQSLSILNCSLQTLENYLQKIIGTNSIITTLIKKLSRVYNVNLNNLELDHETKARLIERCRSLRFLEFEFHRNHEIYKIQCKEQFERKKGALESQRTAINAKIYELVDMRDEMSLLKTQSSDKIVQNARKMSVKLDQIMKDLMLPTEGFLSSYAELNVVEFPFIVNGVTNLTERTLCSPVVYDCLGTAWKLHIKKNSEFSTIGCHLELITSEAEVNATFDLKIFDPDTGKTYKKHFRHLFDEEDDMCGKEHFIPVERAEEYVEEGHDSLRFICRIKHND